MFKQVDESHYEFSRYMKKERWLSLWHQLDEVIKRKPEKVLEIGPGKGLFKFAAKSIGVSVDTFDIDPELNPDYVGSVFELPFEDNGYDIVCAFQMLEHLPFSDSVRAFNEMVRVSNKILIISLPDSQKKWPITIHIPKLGRKTFSISKFWELNSEHIFDGEHYWELNKKNYSIDAVLHELCKSKKCRLLETYRVPENPYHRFFIFEIAKDIVILKP